MDQEYLLDLNQLEAFLATMEQGSIVDAARSLSLSPATLRTRLDALETELGVALLVRTHRGVEPTERGQSFAVGARELLRGAETLKRSAALDEPTEPGELRVMGPGSSLPPMMGLIVAMELRARHPGIKLVFYSSESPIRDAGPDVDMVIHFGDPPEDGPFRTFALSRFPVRLLASTTYIAARGMPTSVEELPSHDLICWLPPSGDGHRWPLLGGGHFLVEPCIAATDVLRLRGLVAAGLGIGLLPDAPVARGTIPGEDLVEVLPETVGREGVLRLMIRESTVGVARTNALKRVLRELAEGVFGVVPGDWLQSRTP